MRGWWTSLLPVVLAACCVVTAGDRPGAAAPPSRSRAGRFLEGIVKKVEPTPAFIPLPQPPSQEEVDRAAAQSRKRPAAAARPAPAVAAPADNKLRSPSWNDAVAIGSQLKDAASKVVDDATNPDYKPNPKAVQPPTAVVAPSPKSRRQTPPIVVTRLQATGAPPPKTQRFERLRARITQTLATYQRRPLNTAHNTPWEVMHGFIAFGIPTQVRVGGPSGDLASAIGWSNMGGRCRGQVMLAAVDDRVVALKGVGVQGHSAQYLAILAQCRVAADGAGQAVHGGRPHRGREAVVQVEDGTDLCPYLAGALFADRCRVDQP
jgi:hypothetical protein